MNELVKIKDVSGVSFVGSLKELYLDVGMDKSNWSRWCKKNIVDNMFFSENKDYQSFVTMTNGNETTDYSCTLDMAKHLVVQMPTENAHKYRQYLIDYEKKNPLDMLLTMDKESLAMTCLQLTTIVKEKDEIIEQKDKQLIEQEPMVSFADKLLKSKANILIGDFAKVLSGEGLKIGSGRLFDWMRTNEYLYKDKKGNNLPYQTYVDRELFYVKENVIESAFKTFITLTPLLTPKGQVYFYEKLKNDEKFK